MTERCQLFIHSAWKADLILFQRTYVIKSPYILIMIVKLKYPYNNSGQFTVLIPCATVWETSMLFCFFWIHRIAFKEYTHWCLSSFYLLFYSINNLSAKIKYLVRPVTDSGSAGKKSTGEAHNVNIMVRKTCKGNLQIVIESQNIRFLIKLKYDLINTIMENYCSKQAHKILKVISKLKS